MLKAKVLAKYIRLYLYLVAPLCFFSRFIVCLDTHFRYYFDDMEQLAARSSVDRVWAYTAIYENCSVNIQCQSWISHYWAILLLRMHSLGLLGLHRNDNLQYKWIYPEKPRITQDLQREVLLGRSTTKTFAQCHLGSLAERAMFGQLWILYCSKSVIMSCSRL